MYHAIAGFADDPNMLCVSPQRFEEQMSYLRRRKLRGVSVGELCRLAGTGDDKNLIGLTFDDGYKDFLHAAVPILERFGFSATVFVVAGLLGKENRWKHAYQPPLRMKLLEPGDLRIVSERGMEVGSHSMTHADLTGLDRRMLEEEVEDSRQVLSEVLGKEVEGICYPYGRVNHMVVEAARQAGYAYGCGWRTPLQYSYSAYNLARVYVSRKDRRLRLAAKLRAYPQYSAVMRYLKSLRG